MSYGTNFPDLFRRAADFVDKILRGAKPADIPVEQPTKFDLVINLKTAKALGLDVPPILLAQIIPTSAFGFDERRQSPAIKKKQPCAVQSVYPSACGPVALPAQERAKVFWHGSPTQMADSELVERISHGYGSVLDRLHRLVRT